MLDSVRSESNLNNSNPNLYLCTDNDTDEAGTAQKQISLQSFVKEVASDSFYRQFESLSDGIVEFKTQETEGQIEHLLRVRALRGRKIDTRRHRLELTGAGEVKVGG